MMTQESIPNNATLAWLATALLIGVLVRLLKSPTLLSTRFQVPSRWRPWVAVGLGQLAGIAEALAAGTPWRTAAFRGLTAAAAAVLGHDAVVKGLFNGREPVSGRDHRLNGVHRNPRDPE